MFTDPPPSYSSNSAGRDGGVSSLVFSRPCGVVRPVSMFVPDEVGSLRKNASVALLIFFLSCGSAVSVDAVVRAVFFPRG